MNVFYKALLAIAVIAVVLAFASVAFFGIAYVAAGPLVGASILLGTLILIQYPFMRLATRYSTRGDADSIRISDSGSKSDQ
jgi:hypothetical protein